MKWKASLALLLLPCHGESTIYGSDNRQLISNKVPHAIQSVARPVAAMFTVSDFKQDLEGRNWVIANSLKDEFRLCKGQRFANQPTAAECTGFLISPTRLATAGHCIDDETTCSNMVWVFDFRQGSYKWANQELSFAPKQIYRCQRVLAYHDNDDQDFAVIELDRPVTDRAPVTLAPIGSPLRHGDPLFVVGHPSGLPQVWARNGKLVKSSQTRSKAEVDTFENNSGSPVFATTTHKVIGILVSGDEDYERDYKRHCNVTVKCQAADDDCDGESFTASDLLWPYLN